MPITGTHGGPQTEPAQVLSATAPKPIPDQLSPAIPDRDRIQFFPSSEEYQAYLSQEQEQEVLEAKHRQGQQRGIKLTNFYLVNQQEDGSADVEYTVEYTMGIRRTRRITGYLSEMVNFNPAKAAELLDRKSYSIGNPVTNQVQDILIDPSLLANTISAGGGRPENMSVEIKMFQMAQMQRELEGEKA